MNMDAETRNHIRRERDRIMRKRLNGRPIFPWEGSKRPATWPPLVTVARNGQITGQIRVAYVTSKTW
jgi:hypothetical protein